MTTAMLELECNDITRHILPAIRASVSESLSSRYNFSQQQIADKLGIAQVAVSKYLNGRYSERVNKIKTLINSQGLCEDIVKQALESDSETLNMPIQKLCSRIATLKLVY
ncbi:MAG: helix-turn-helix domain-containing protein [Candidatus Micrarchaeota archaeon]|nr:helix-turn-helix domain-containing protein [Candidatus Micrarchaeota archaeon]MDE1834279.1 helix-turn-helix domain-containing protein [Candidatus Micrarchaeota archaeon]MDE1859419.1 helix-turn-helix domain-containing protein [Candidatus Micrarchaeota archaeon]